MANTKEIIILGLVLFTAIIFSYIFYSGPFVYYDDNYYIFSAHQMLQGTFRPNGNPFTVETLTIASIALSFFLFGYGPLQAALPSVVEYLATIIVIFFLGRKMFNDYFGGVASFLYATAPFVVGYTTRALPDIFTGFTVAIACYYIYNAIELKSERAMFLAGFFIALTMLVKTAGAIIIASFVIGLAYLYAHKKFRRYKRMLAYAFVGMIIPLAMMMLYFYLLTGNPLFNLHSYTGIVNVAPTTVFKNIIAFNISINPLYLFNVNQDPYTFPIGIIFILAFAGMILGIARKKTLIETFSLLVLISMLYLFFGTKSLNHYIPIAVVSRYLAIVAAPIAILAAYTLNALYIALRKESKVAAFFIIIAIIFYSVFINLSTYRALYFYNLGVRSYNTIYSTLLHVIDDNHANRVYILSMLEGLNQQYLEFLYGFNVINFSFVGPICTPSYYGAMLLDSFNNFAAKQNNASLISWLDDNCSIINIASYKVDTGPNLWTEGELFKIVPR